MKIIVNNTAASSGGAISILNSLYNYVLNSEHEKSNEWVFLLGDNYLEEKENIKVIVLKKTKKSWLARLSYDLYEGKKIISELQPDIVFSLQNTIIFGIEGPQILYMHQSLPFQNAKKFSFFKKNERNLAIYQYLIGTIIKKSIKKADLTIVQTNWIKEAVIKKTRISNSKIIAVLPPLDNVNVEKYQSNFSSRNFFYPAGKSIYKNHECIYEAIKILRDFNIQDFEIALTVNMERELENILYLGPISREEVIKRYSSSTLVFPSYIETLGLPLIEARLIGTIILVADCPYSREVLHGYENAYFFNPFQPSELAFLMKKVISGEIKKNQSTYELKENSWESVSNIIMKIGES